MQKRQVGPSGLELPAVTFGAWAIGGLFWGGTEDGEAIRAIHAALDCGIDAIDTAPAYGCGHSEEVIARAIEGVRREVKLLTKCGLRWDDEGGEYFFRLEQTPDGKPVTIYKNVRAASIIRECEESLRRLKTDVIDLYQVHWPSTTAAAEETMGALERLKRQGKILHYGVSNYSGDQMKEALQYGSIVSNQIEYNLLERDIEKDELPFCRDHGIGVVVYSPMALGLLTGKAGMERQFPPSDIRSGSPLFAPANRRRVLEAFAGLSPVSSAHGATPGQLAVAWILAQPGIATALVGARNAEQVRENARAASLRLSAEEVEAISRAFEFGAD